MPTVQLDSSRPSTTIPAQRANPLADSLDNLRLEGAIFLRADYTEPWSYESLSGAATAEFLRPGSARVILFHVVAEGGLWISARGERHWASAGDVIVLPYGDQHVMSGTEPTETVPIECFMTAPPWHQMPVLRYGGGGDRTAVICGYLASDDPLFDPSRRAFPPVFVVRPSGGAAEWVDASIRYALSQTAIGSSGRLDSPTRLPELLLVEMLRLHLASAPAADHGWVSALRDPVLAPAMALIHRAPQVKWSVATLAAASAVSTSVLDERFRRMLGRAPIKYLSEWRMHVAEDLLATGDPAVAAVARRVGFDSEEAFSRAFKRSHGESPSMWRARRRS